MDVFTKPDVFTKHNVSLEEYTIHQLVYNMNIVNVPRIISYDNDKQILIMQRLGNCSYDGVTIDRDIFDDIRDIIRTLYDHNIEYPEITGRNFIEYENKLWIVNFEHARQFTPDPIIQQDTGLDDLFVKRFISRSLYQWNPKYSKV